MGSRKKNKYNYSHFRYRSGLRQGDILPEPFGISVHLGWPTIFATCGRTSSWMQDSWISSFLTQEPPLAWTWHFKEQVSGQIVNHNKLAFVPDSGLVEGSREVALLCQIGMTFQKQQRNDGLSLLLEQEPGCCSQQVKSTGAVCGRGWAVYLLQEGWQLKTGTRHKEHVVLDQSETYLMIWLWKLGQDTLKEVPWRLLISNEDWDSNSFRQNQTFWSSYSDLENDF